jgi:hypothetical protein
MEIYVLIDNQPNGPYTPELIRQYLKSGELQPEQLAAYAGSADWKPLSMMTREWPAAPAAKSSASRTAAVALPKRKRKLLLPILAGVVVLLLVAGGFAYWKFFGDSGPIVKVVTPAEPGLPNTLAELNTWYAELPEGQNAATFFLKGFEAMQITDADRNSKDLPLIGKGTLPALGSPLSPRTKAAIAALTQRNKVALENFQKGATIEQSRYPMDLNQGYDTLLPHVGKVKQAAQFGELTSLLLADSKQLQSAADVLLTSLASAQSLKYEPLLISQLVRVSCLAIAKTNLEQVVNLVALPSAELNRLATAFAKAESDESSGTAFTRTTAGERASCLAVFDLPPDKLEVMLKKMSGGRPTESGESGGGAVQNLAIKKLTRNLKSQRAFVEETFNRSIVMRKQSFPERLKTDEYFTSRMAEAKTNDFQFCLMLMPALGKQTSREAGGLATLRVAQTAIALERFRAANNRYPTTLVELAPAFLPAAPQDPFDGEPLRYKKIGDGYEVNSIGADPAKPITFKMIKPPKSSVNSSAASAGTP